MALQYAYPVDSP
ncbi:AMP-binding enzyme domain-containing protein, partial [Toxoplasma gondii RUB]